MTLPFITWESNMEVQLHTVAELDHVLDRLTIEIAKDHPMMVHLVGPTGDTLSMGIGQRMSLLSFTPASGDPPYLVSVGDEAAEGSIIFYVFGEWSEFPQWQCIPVDTARQAMRDFFQHGKLSEQVKWKEV